MRIKLYETDENKLRLLNHIKKANEKVIDMYCYYLIKQPLFITKDLVDDIVNSCSVTKEYAFYVLLGAVCGLDMERNEDRLIGNEYLIPSIKLLDASEYRENAYYKNIKIPECIDENWQFKQEKYEPYEGFIYNDLVVEPNFVEIPRLGFFDEEFYFPAVLENGVEWMTITPNEIETMQPVIDRVKGNVITFGLGLGYFTYMVSEKKEVESITVIEKDEHVINLFIKHILPQFAQKQKVRIIKADAFEYVKTKMVHKVYEYAFVDMWHNASDGLQMYLKMKKLEYLCPKTEFLYWIEESILSNLRWQVYEEYLEWKKDMSFDELIHYLHTDSLKELAKIL